MTISEKLFGFVGKKISASIFADVFSGCSSRIAGAMGREEAEKIAEKSLKERRR